MVIVGSLDAKLVANLRRRTGLWIMLAPDLRALRDLVSEERPELVVLDVTLGGNEETAIAVVPELVLRYEGLSVILLSRSPTPKEIRYGKSKGASTTLDLNNEAQVALLPSIISAARHHEKELADLLPPRHEQPDPKTLHSRRKERASASPDHPQIRRRRGS